MGVFVNRVLEGAGRTLWLDCVDYAGALLAGGAIPWLETSACAAWQRKAHGLLTSDVITLPIGRVCAAWLAAQPGLRTALGARSRAVYPLRTLLGDDALRSHLVELVRALRGSVPGPIFALSCPSPRAWIVEAYQHGHGTAVDAGDDEADSAALYIADFLRVFGETGIDVVVLVESTASEPATAADIACYRSILNVAAHYRWDAGLNMPGTRYAGGDAGVDFVIAPRALSGPVPGIVVPEAFWNGATPPDPVVGSFRYATAPTHADPERVLERLALLR